MSVRRKPCTPHPLMKELRKARKSKNITQEGLAKLSGYSLSTVQFSELGYVQPSLLFVVNCAEALDMELRLCFKR